MLKPRFTGPFKRERKLMQKRGKEINKLTEVIGMIINELLLPPERNNH
jgi:mRNA-degrading endonuclease YafQ of YafQ-DinJ toxin-antitoxin module